MHQQIKVRPFLISQQRQHEALQHEVLKKKQHSIIYPNATIEPAGRI